ncbi:unnamed protein product [Closterium sp. Naga37s-1]|nr:unnamed protein product [Closterium sp. Naga37s-1]
MGQNSVHIEQVSVIAGNVGVWARAEGMCGREQGRRVLGRAGRGVGVGKGGCDLCAWFALQGFEWRLWWAYGISAWLSGGYNHALVPYARVPFILYTSQQPRHSILRSRSLPILSPFPLLPDSLASPSPPVPLPLLSHFLTLHSPFPSPFPPFPLPLPSHSLHFPSTSPPFPSLSPPFPAPFPSHSRPLIPPAPSLSLPFPPFSPPYTPPLLLVPSPFPPHPLSSHAPDLNQRRPDQNGEPVPVCPATSVKEAPKRAFSPTTASARTWLISSGGNPSSCSPLK